jgi:hypothetical protein
MNTYKTMAATAIAGLLATGTLLLPTGASAKTAVPECANADLKASFVATGAATSHRFGRLRLKNISKHTCAVQGYGGLSFVGKGNGTRIGAPAQRTPSKTPLVLLEPGQRAVSAVSMTTTGPYPRKVCHPAKVDGFRVYAPDATASQFVPFKTTACANRHLHTLAHKAYRRP